MISSLCLANGLTASPPPIFPIPQELTFNNNDFEIDNHTFIIIPTNASEKDISLANLLVKELSDKYGKAIRILKTDIIPKDKKTIIMGTKNNSLVNQYCIDRKINISDYGIGAEGYMLQVNKSQTVICGVDDEGAFYGYQSLRQLLRKSKGSTVQGMHVKDWPRFPFRAFRLYVPGPENFPYFKRLISDFMAMYKYNKLIIEFNSMRLDRHPEVNTGWLEFVKYMQYSRSNETLGPKGEVKNSSHYDASDGRIIEKSMVKDLVSHAKNNFLEVIPEIPSLTHAYYLLSNHRELAEYPLDPWPDTYCPSNSDSYKLMFDVYDEYIEVINPKMVNIGHDEWWGAPIGVCSRCKDKHYADLYADDVAKIHGYFKKKGIRVAMWGDYLLENVRGKGIQYPTSKTGVPYQIPGALPRSVVQQKIPKDILILNWFWASQENERSLDSLGFQQIYGNFTPNISDWDNRTAKINLAGAAPSSWAATTEFNIGKDLILDLMGSANLLWSNHTIDQLKLQPVVWQHLPYVRADLRGKLIPSNDVADLVVPVAIDQLFNTPKNSSLFNLQLQDLQVGEIHSGNTIFNLPIQAPSDNAFIAVSANGNEDILLPDQVLHIQINEDVSSLIFLHASALPAGNQKSYFNMPNKFDSADLLGWYEVVYDDGYKITVPIQYGVNIMEWNPGGEKSLDTREGDTGAPQQAYCYEADAVNCANSLEAPIFYSYEWVNKRFGKSIKEVNLYGIKSYEALEQNYGKVTSSPMKPNAILLAAVSKVKKIIVPIPASK